MKYFISIAFIIFTTTCVNADFKFVSQERHNELLNLLPCSEDRFLDKLKNQNVIFYDDDILPQCHQNEVDGGKIGFYHNTINPAGSGDVFGQPNQEFPWRHPLGTDHAGGYNLRFLILPEGKKIKYKVGYVNPYFYGRTGNTLIWTYPDGTIFGEIITVANNNEIYPSIVRLRIKTNEVWKFRIYMARRSRDELISWIKINVSGWFLDKDLSNYVDKNRFDYYGITSFLKREELSFNNVARQVVNNETILDKLPNFDKEIVKKLLGQTKFQLITSWVNNGVYESFAPTTDSDFNIVPKHYFGGLVSKRECMNCHNTTLQHAQLFNNTRDWYHRVRGSDSIISFHIIDPQTISYNNGYVPYNINKALVNAGLVEHE